MFHFWAIFESRLPFFYNVYKYKLNINKVFLYENVRLGVTPSMTFLLSTPRPRARGPLRAPAQGPGPPPDDPPIFKQMCIKHNNILIYIYTNIIIF